jgi:DNA topoisomerase-1
VLHSRAMSKNLVVVESPAKARTIERYLGPGYRVLASLGHVRDLPENPGKNGLGVDVEGDFAPQYVVVEERKKQVAAISRAAQTAERVYLATDLDREGEAIAWHIVEAAGVPAAKARRVTFNEITERAIREAFAHPRDIDRNLVDAQQARRVVDRLVGYTLSPLLWRKVRAGLSAGRVQSVAVRLVVDREREIATFQTREYWTLEAVLAKAVAAAPTGGQDAGATQRPSFRAEVVRIDGKKPEIGDAATASAHAAALACLQPLVRGVSRRTRKTNPPPPFTTSTLQQEASRKLGFNPRRTMLIAQQLYEGVESAGQVGLITYMRTDSVHLASSAQAEARQVISGLYGPEYAMPHGRSYRTKTKGAQEAHEAIRPTSFARTPDSLEGQLSREQLRLYRLVWQRAIASQMAPKEQEITAVDLEAQPYSLRATATRTLFEGYARVYTESRDDATEEPEVELPELAQGDATRVLEVVPQQHFTEPPPRYTEASLIKALEEKGIGRPSTYASIIGTIIDRGYVVVRERRLHPEPVGIVVTDLLVEHFGEFVDPGFTARMEEDLDQVASGNREWVPLVREFYLPLRERAEAKRRELRRRDFTTEPSDEVCSQGHPMVVRLGRYGRFLACSLYPEHKETRPLPEEAGGGGAVASPGDPGGASDPTSPGEAMTPATSGSAAGPALAGVGEPCPSCGEGTLTAKRGRYGPFVGCSRYPECRYVRRDRPPAAPPPQLPFEVACPTCGEGHLVTKRARASGRLFWGCSRYPSCDYTTSHQPLGPVHDVDAGPVAARGKGAICLRCGAAVEVPEGTAPGTPLPGGPANPAALLRPSRAGAARSGRRTAAAGGRAGTSSRARRSAGRISAAPRA